MGECGGMWVEVVSFEEDIEGSGQEAESGRVVVNSSAAGAEFCPKR